jgi:curli biogenesis system outer membrane secretion channel CsgG
MRTMLIGAALALLAFSSASAYASSAQDDQDKKQAQIPTCTRNLGTIAVREPDNDWWTAEHLPSPEVLLKVFVRKSGCFTLLDRGKGFELAQQERELAAGGTLRRGSNIGKGQVRAADYVLVPDIANQNGHAGGFKIGTILGALIPGIGGAIASGLSLDSKTADVVLSIVDVRSSQDGPIEQGHASKTDLSFGGGGLGIGGSGFAAAGLSAYEDTDVGQVTTLAYIDAYTKLVSDMGGLPASASAASVPQAVSMARPGHLFTMPSAKSKPIRLLATSDLLYPTGQQDGQWWQAKDEAGDLGWVRSDLVQIAK